MIVGGVTSGTISVVNGGQFGEAFAYSVARGALTAYAGYKFNCMGGHPFFNKLRNFYLKNLKLEPYDVRTQGVSNHANWIVNKSGLKTLPESAKSAALVVAVSETVIWGWAVAGPYVLANPQSALDFTMSMFPGTAPSPTLGGLAGDRMGNILNTSTW